METRELKSGYAKPEYPGTRTYRLATRADIEAANELPFLTIHGTVCRARRNGKIKTWKRSPSRFEAPMKYGMYECWRADDDSQSRWIPGSLLVEVDNA